MVNLSSVNVIEVHRPHLFIPSQIRKYLHLISPIHDPIRPRGLRSESVLMREEGFIERVEREMKASDVTPFLFIIERPIGIETWCLTIEASEGSVR
jgi:hypothetical protein